MRRLLAVLSISIVAVACSTGGPGLFEQEDGGGGTGANNGGPNNGAPNNGGSNNGSPDGGPNNGYDAGPGWTTGAFNGGFPPPPAGLAVTTESYDVAIFGAGTGGSAAAIQAGRMGVRVALVEETDWVGGQMTAGGVSTMDEGNFNFDAGIYIEFIERVKAHYASLGKRARRCGIRRIPCMEPAVGDQILREMLGEAGVTLIERARPIAGRVEQGRLTAVRTYQKAHARILEVEAGVFVDATEYGDLLPLANIPYRSGNTTSDALDLGACVQDITYAPIIKRYDSVPAALRVETAPPGYGPEVEAKFAAIVVQNGGVDWEADGWGAGYPTDWKTHVSYRATPDSSRPGDSTIGDYQTITKTGLNWANDYPYTAGDLETRRFEVNCEAKLHTLQFLYYMQNVLGQSDWSLADDQGFDSPYNVEENNCPNIPAEFDELEKQMTPIPYVRESRRMIGMMTMKASDVDRVAGSGGSRKRFPSSIAVGDYAMDLHACNEAGSYEAGLETAADLPPGFVGGPFQIPMDVLLPQSVEGFIAAEKNISQTRLVSGATRLQPSTMATGQAAGALAALAIQRGEAPRAVPAVLVQDALVEAGARIGVTKFSDVAQDSPFWPSIEFASGRQILVGYEDGTFKGAESLPRANSAVFLARLFELDTSSPPATPSFGDVPSSHWAYREIEAVKTAGISLGCGDGANFCPADTVTRAQMATFLARGLGFNGNAPGGPTFGDVPSTSPHYAAIEWLALEGIVSGCTASPAMYCPGDDLTRSQAAVLARRALVWKAR